MKHGVNELRRSYLEFFESKEHLAMKSFSLVPQNDNSLLLINAGMAPLKPYFTGQEVPPRKRVTTCQKCIRTGDIDNVGKTARHLTFFEMLGNFSFGDYFKKEAIHWSWEYLTEVLGLDPERLYPSIYGEDDEAFKIWNEEIGIPGEKITRFYRDPETGECDNFWEHGAGPCGPCSEIYYDRGEKYGCGKPDCKVGCDCDRFMEVWNNVFTQFEGDGHGNYTELSQKNIDTGMGLERLAVVMQDVDSVFDIDTMKEIRDKVCELSHKTYQTDVMDDVSIRLITDHIRSATFMISDGIRPGTGGREYVLRRIIRRAARHGRILGIEGLFMSRLAEVVINNSKDGYPELDEKKEFIFTTLNAEEERFNRTLDNGLARLAEMEEEMKAKGQKVLSGENAFMLYDTFGFPTDLTAEILEEKGYSYDEAGFEKCMAHQKETARGARKETNYMGADATVYNELPTDYVSEFDGYQNITEDEVLKDLVVFSEEGGSLSNVLAEGDKGAIISEKTPFYATMGGQQGDKGVIFTDGGKFIVEDTVKVVGNKIAHVGYVESGIFTKGKKATFAADEGLRSATCKNHSATHLLQKALREVLGNHVEQAGSYQDPSRTRFDFSHDKAMTAEELRKVEDMVNQKIAEKIPVVTQVMAIDEARKSGAMALFGEKYGEEVRVVSMGDFSKEFCGGTHVKNTGEIGTFKIVSESGIAGGTRRIEAITGDNVIAYYREIEEEFHEAAAAAKSTPQQLKDKILSMQKEIKELSAQLESLKAKAAREALGDATSDMEDVAGVKLIKKALSGVDMNGLRDLGDELKGSVGECGVIVLASENEGKVSLMIMATDGAIKKGAHAGNLIKALAPMVGGGGGGRPNMAQAGGKNPAGISDAMDAAADALKEQINQ
ncbi:MAG: alanine--tRNA ligase [Lachnospiraceae bacterium]|nr:alanine--tRNA ligase [Lachnospiraceae bacterium]